MTPLQLELTRLIGKKDETFGCLFTYRNSYPSYDNSDIFIIGKDKKDSTLIYEIIGHPATLSDFHSWMNEKNLEWEMIKDHIGWVKKSVKQCGYIPYDSSKELLDQDEETLNQIVELIRDNK